MVVSFDDVVINDKEPLYLKVYRILRKKIVEGEYEYGQKLESEAVLAKKLSVGRTTLRSALILLYEDDYITTEQGKGTYVTYREDKKKKEINFELLRNRLLEKYKNLKIETTKNNVIDEDEFLFEKLLAKKGEKIKFLEQKFVCDDELVAISQIFTLEDVENIEDVIIDKVHRIKYSIVQTKNTSNYCKEKSILLMSSDWLDRNNNVIIFTKDYICDYEYRLNFEVGRE